MTLLSDGTVTNETRLGAIGGMDLALREVLGYDDALLVVAADTLIDEGFDLDDMVKFFHDKNAEEVNFLLKNSGDESSVQYQGYFCTYMVYMV